MEAEVGVSEETSASRQHTNGCAPHPSARLSKGSTHKVKAERTGPGSC